MKKITILFLSILCYGGLFSQNDTIVKVNGIHIPCTITFNDTKERMYYKIGSEDIQQIELSKVYYFVQDGKKTFPGISPIPKEKKPVRRNITIDIGINKSSKWANNIVFFNAKNMTGNFGITIAYLGGDLDKDIKQAPSGNSYYPTGNFSWGQPYGGAAGINYSWNRTGLTFILLGTSYSQKQIQPYYNMSATWQQNASSDYKYSTVQHGFSIGAFIEYDFLRKFRFVELGVRVGYDLLLRAEAGAFIGFKLERK